MTALDDYSSAVIIESRNNVRWVTNILKKSFVKNIAVINIRCLYDQFAQVQDLMNNDIRLKIFHSGNIGIFNNIIKSFGIDSVKRGDIIYIQHLNRQEVVRSYWNYYFKKFPPTILKSARGGSFSEEI